MVVTALFSSAHNAMLEYDGDDGGAQQQGT
jgi:hypothetical protein